MADTKELQYKLVLSVDDFKKAIKEANAEIKTVADETEKANKKIAEANAKVAEAQKDLQKYSVIATTALTAAAAASVNMANKFNEGFGKVATLMPGATERIHELQDSVLELSPAVGKTTADLTEGLYEIVSAIGDSADSAKILETTAKTATAGGATTKEAFNLLSAVTKAYGDTSLAAQKKVSDLAFTTIKYGQTSLPELAASIQQVTSSSKDLGVSQEELFASFSSTTGVIGNAAIVATKLKATLTELKNPSKELQEAFQELGVSTGQELIEKFGGFQGALNALEKTAEKSGEKIDSFFGSVNAKDAALYLAGTGAKKFASDLEAMGNAAGAADEAFAETSETGVNSFGFQLQQLQLNAQKFAIKLGQELIPAVQTLLQPVMKIVNVLANASPAWMALIGSITKMVVAMGLLTTGMLAYNKVKTKAIALQKAFNTAMAANPVGAATLAITGAVVALQSLCQWLDKSKQKANETKIAAEKAKQAENEQAKEIEGLAGRWADLSEMKERNAKQEKEFTDLTKQLDDTIGTTTGHIQDREGKIKAWVSAAKAQAHATIQAEHEQQEAIEKTKKQLDERREHLKMLTDGSDEQIKKKTDNDKEYQRINELLKSQEATLESIRQKRAELLSITEKNFLPTEKLEAEPEDTKETGKGKEDPLQKTIREQDERLKALDEAHQRELAIIKGNKDKARITEAQANKQIESEKEKHYDERKKLLENFINERMQAGASYEQAVAAMLRTQNKTISAEVSATYEHISDIAKEKLNKELAGIKQIAEDAKTEIESESEKKFNAGDFGDKKSSDAKRAQYKYQIAQYEEKSLELTKQIAELSKDDADAHKEKIAALQEENKELAKMQSNAETNLKNVSNTLAETTKKAADKIQEYGQVANQTVSGITNIATDIIGQKQKANAEKLAGELADIKRRENETMMELENEYLDWKEEKQQEQQEREEARAEAEFEKQQEQMTRGISETQAAFNQEVNIQKAKNREKDLEEKRRAQAEAIQKKKEADEEKKRQKEERRQEIEMLNAKAFAQYEFQVATINAQNASAQSEAQFARQSAQWQKAQSVTNLIVQTAINTAMAAAKTAESFTNPLAIPAAAAYYVAAAISAAQIGVVSAAPLPSGSATPAPLPPAPRPIKFAQGGIVYPSAGGTRAALASGNPAVIGEGGIPEIILPVNQANLEAVFKAQGITNNASSTTIAPTYNITVMNEQGENIGETIMTTLRSNDRELLALVENTKRMTYVGE